MFIAKRFEKVGDPVVLKEGSREERRRKLIEKYREDIQKRKAKMDVLEISDSDEDCFYPASNEKSVKNLIPSRNAPVQRVSDWSQNDDRSIFPRSHTCSTWTRVFLPENEKFPIYGPNGLNNNDLMQNRNLTDSQMSNKVKSTVPKRKIENESSIATKKSRIFEEPTTEVPECRKKVSIS